MAVLNCNIPSSLLEELTRTAEGILTEVSRGMDKWLWFVEAHSQAAN
jgi:hypothetical protein